MEEVQFIPEESADCRLWSVIGLVEGEYETRVGSADYLLTYARGAVGPVRGQSMDFASQFETLLKGLILSIKSALD